MSCNGTRLCCRPESLEDLEGFKQRAERSFFQTLLDPETDQLKDSTGALVINTRELADVERVWGYLTQGIQPGETSFEKFVRWRELCDFFLITVPDPLADLRVPDPLADVRLLDKACAYATHNYLIVRAPRSADLSPMCYSMRCAEACDLRSAPLGFDHVCDTAEGALHLEARNCDPPVEVKLDPEKGKLEIRFMKEASMWQYIGGHACLKYKRMRALKVRFPRETGDIQAHSSSGGKGAKNSSSASRESCSSTYQVVELYIHASPKGVKCENPCVAAWPSFWCLVRHVRHRAYNHNTWASWNTTFEICPGAVFLMADDLVVQVVSQLRSLRKCYLRICGGDLEQEVRAKLVAPAPFSTPHARGGKGKASYPGKGVGPSLKVGQKYYKYAVPSYDTPTPEDAARSQKGRCMQQVWVVRRRGPNGVPHLCVLLHSIDGRVTIAQLSGENGCIPRLYGMGSGPGNRKTCAIWGAKAWHWGPNQHGVGGIGQYRRSYDVPKCHQVLAVALEEDNRIVVLHKPRAKICPQLWVVSPPQEVAGSEATTSFFRIHGKGKGTGGKNQGGKGNSIGPAQGGSWNEDRWGTSPNARQLVLPDDIVEDTDAKVGEPLLVPLWAGAEGMSPEVEVLRLTGMAEEDNQMRRRQDAEMPPWLLPQRAGGRGLGSGPSPSGAALPITWHVKDHVHYICREPLVPPSRGC